MNKTRTIEIVVEAESGEQAYQFFGEYLPDVSVIDISMPGMGGLEAARRILARYSSARLLIFSMHENAAFATQALKAGIRGYVAKAGPPNELLTAVLEVAQGKTYISSNVVQKIALQSVMGKDESMQKLSAREFEIFRLLAEGKTTEEIGKLLKISQKTVANYCTLMKQKLGISTSFELVRMAMRQGIIEGNLAKKSPALL